MSVRNLSLVKTQHHLTKKQQIKTARPVPQWLVSNIISSPTTHPVRAEEKVLFKKLHIVIGKLRWWEIHQVRESIIGNKWLDSLSV